MDYLPIFLNLQTRNCLVVGGGAVAARKIVLLCAAGASITVVAPQISAGIKARQLADSLTLCEKTFSPADLQGMNLVIAATDNHAVNLCVAEAAKQQNLLINVVDNPALGNFIFPAIIDRSPVIAAISSGGAAPVLARVLRSKIEAGIPAGFGLLAKLAEKFRPLAKQCIPQSDQRRRFWEEALQGPIAERVFAGKQQQAELELEALLRSKTQSETRPGEVFLVGAGPGDPDLLTLRALRLIQQADVIVYDRLVSKEILELSRRDAEKIYVGKQRDLHSLPQASINSLLAELAVAGKRVVRLKGGDPFIFGRGGEEIETLWQQGVSFQVVPGITAASGCASYAGIPLTHRDHAQSCTFVTGHLQDGSMDLNWRQLSAPRQTVVIYMGLVGLSYICRQLMAHGCPADHPVAIVQQGTTTNQKVLTGNLSDIAERAELAGIKPPTLIIIGTVVTLNERLAWFTP